MAASAQAGNRAAMMALVVNDCPGDHARLTAACVPRRLGLER